MNFIGVSFLILIGTILAIHYYYFVKKYISFSKPHNTLQNEYNLLKLSNLSQKEEIHFSLISFLEEGNSMYTNIWWVKNLHFSPNGVITNFYPKGSYKPSAFPVWWAWFIAKLSKNHDYAKLSYDIKFDENFDFVKWWKLPWFCGGTCPRWWSSAESWFSTRFMWRENGLLEVYAYLLDSDNPMWESLGRWMFQFTPWRYYNISQEILLNTPGVSDGILVVKINHIPVYIKKNLNFRKTKDLQIDSILYSTFFGWGDSSWATPVDTNTQFKNFVLEYE